MLPLIAAQLVKIIYGICLECSCSKRSACKNVSLKIPFFDFAIKPRKKTKECRDISPYSPKMCNLFWKIPFEHLFLVNFSILLGVLQNFVPFRQFGSKISLTLRRVLTMCENLNRALKFCVKNALSW